MTDQFHARPPGARDRARREPVIEPLRETQVDTIASSRGSSPLLREAQGELRLSQRRLAAVFEGSTEGIVLFDDTGALLDANPMACALVEATREQVLRMTAASVLTNPEEARQKIQTVRTDGALDGETEIVTAKGSRRLIAYRAVANIIPGLHMAMLRDVTEARHAQIAQARLAALVESSADAILGCGPDGAIDAWNRGAEHLYGYTEEEALGRHVSFLAPPGDRSGAIDIVQRVLGGQTISQLEVMRRRKDGTDVAVSLTVSPVRDSSGAVIGCSAIGRDISQQKRAEERFRELLESAPDAMIVVESPGVISLVNRQAERLFGYERNELIGAPLDMLIPQRHRQRHARHTAAFLECPSPRLMTENRELRATRKDGTEIAVEITLSPLHGLDERNAIAAIRDVTDKNRMRDQLIISDRMVSIGTLAAGVAHEINNPLAAVTTNIELALQTAESLGDSVDRDELIEELSDAREASERVRRIVRDLKIFSRGRAETIGPVDPRVVMESTLRLAWNEIRHRARLVKDYGGASLVCANESRLGQIFLNLVVNAAQAIPEGHIDENTIRVSTAVGPGGEVVVTVADSGAGMSPDVQKQLFTPFFTTKPVGQGTGLGLSICQRLVNEINGRMEVESAVGRGTTFRVYLPPATLDDCAPAEPLPTVPAARRRGRVLVIDDEPALAKAIGRTLSREHDVVTRTSAEEALEEIIAGQRFDVILCDLMMPQMTGMDFHVRLAEVAPDQAERTIFMTGGAFTPWARDFLASIASLRIEKPFDTQYLRTLVNDRIR